MRWMLSELQSAVGITAHSDRFRLHLETWPDTVLRLDVANGNIQYDIISDARHVSHLTEWYCMDTVSWSEISFAGIPAHHIYSVLSMGDCYFWPGGGSCKMLSRWYKRRSKSHHLGCSGKITKIQFNNIESVSCWNLLTSIFYSMYLLCDSQK